MLGEKMSATTEMRKTERESPKELHRWNTCDIQILDSQRQEIEIYGDVGLGQSASSSLERKMKQKKKNLIGSQNIYKINILKTNFIKNKLK